MGVEVVTAAEYAATVARVDALVARVAALEAPQPAPVPVPPPVPVPTPSGQAGRITRQGTRLMLNGKRYKAAGMNWDQAVGCGLPGSQPTDAQATRYFAELNPESITRVWVMPGMDLTKYDRIVKAASARGQHLCVALLNGLKDCTTRQATYETPVAADIAKWVRDVVSRHAGNPAVAMFEPANEAAEGNPNIANWYQAMARLIKSVDPAVLVGTGGGNNSNDPVKIAAFSAGADVDLISYHDYYKPAGSKGPRAAIFERAAELANKPWYLGERGFSGPVGGGSLGSQEANAPKLADEYRIHLAMERCAAVLYWDYKLVQPEDTTARPESALWKVACDFRVSAPPAGS